MMIDHMSLGAKDYGRAVRFFQECLSPLGYTLQRDTGQEAAFGTAASWGFFVYPVEAAASHIGARTHVAFSALSEGAVKTFHAAAVNGGATSVRPPGPRPDISPEYFGTVLTDAEGHTIEAVHWRKIV